MNLSKHPAETVKITTTKLEAAVRCPHAIKPADPIITFLLKLNLQRVEKKKCSPSITPPGLPILVKKLAAFTSDDCGTIINEHGLMAKCGG